VIINQLAFPGMGTVMAGRRVGYAQAVLMLAGFFLVMAFMCCYFASLASFILHSNGAELSIKELCRPYASAGLSGVALCAVAWLWALVSSLGILRAAAGTAVPERGVSNAEQKL